jgi:RecJ-like exonuclease
VRTCPDCNGEGVIGKGTDDEQQCPRCGGSGFVPDDDDDEEVTRTASWWSNPAMNIRCPFWVLAEHPSTIADHLVARTSGITGATQR